MAPDIHVWKPRFLYWFPIQRAARRPRVLRVKRVHMMYVMLLPVKPPFRRTWSGFSGACLRFRPLTPVIQAWKSLFQVLFCPFQLLLARIRPLFPCFSLNGKAEVVSSVVLREVFFPGNVTCWRLA